MEKPNLSEIDIKMLRQKTMGNEPTEISGLRGLFLSRIDCEHILTNSFTQQSIFNSGLKYSDDTHVNLHEVVPKSKEYSQFSMSQLYKPFELYFATYPYAQRFDIDGYKNKVNRKTIHITSNTIYLDEKALNVLKMAHSIASHKQSPQKKQRVDPLAAEYIPMLQENPKLTPTQLMTLLLKQIDKPDSCIISNTGGGLKWEPYSGHSKLLTVKGLESRISRWRKRNQ
jgi:hypothetical protein